MLQWCCSNIYCLTRTFLDRKEPSLFPSKMKVCTEYSTYSIVPFRIMPHCRGLSAVAKLVLLLVTTFMTWVFVLLVMKTFITMEAEWLGILHDRLFIPETDGNATHLQKDKYLTKLLELSLNTEKQPLQPKELSTGGNQGSNKGPVHTEALEHDASNNKENKQGEDKKEIHYTPEPPRAQDNTQSSNNSGEGHTPRPQEVLQVPPPTFIPVEPDTSPLRRPPDIPKRFLIEEADYCRKRPNLQIIAYVHSAINRVEERMDTRRSWGNASAYNMGAMNVSIGVVFMVGRAKNILEERIVKEESEKYHDIVQGTYGDHYRLLTYKGLAGLYWIDKHCAHVPWTLHSDDDTHIDIFLYHQALQQLNNESKEKFVCSHMYGPALRYGRYKVRYEEYPGKEYPLYCSGGVWFLQTKLIKRLLRARESVPYVWVDDAYITGLLARRAGIGQHPFQGYYGGPHANPERIGKEVAWFVKFVPRTEWWQKIVEYHKKHSMQRPATLEPKTAR